MKQVQWFLGLLTAGAITLVPTGLLAEEGTDFTVSSSATEIVGELSAEGKVLLEFSSRQESFGTTEIEMSYAGALFKGSYDSEASVLRIRGFGAKVLPDDKPLIQRAHDELVRRKGDANPSDLKHFLLERMLLLLSDAPAGFVWDELEIEIGVERQGVDEFLLQDPEPFAGCNEEDDDDDTPIGCNVKVCLSRGNRSS